MHFIVIILGRTNTGKTGLFNRYAFDRCHLEYTPSIDTHAWKKDIQTKLGDASIFLYDWNQIDFRKGKTWDTFLNAASGVILAYDVSSSGEKSVDEAEQFFINMRDIETLCCIALVGCKSDLGTSLEVEVKADRLFGRIKSEFHGSSFRITTSAAHNVNVDELLHAMANCLLQENRW